jgi:hypothetical protein
MVASLGLLMASLITAEVVPPARAQSTLLESVRRNPARAKALCAQLREMNAQGLSYTSSQATTTVAAQESVSLMEAEVLITYVVGIHCPDLR